MDRTHRDPAPGAATAPPTTTRTTTTTIAARIAALRRMTVDQLRAEYERVFGEATRSRHREYLWKRIAWRIQAEEEGGLSERALRRAAELARDADVRVRPPRGAFDGIAAAPARTETVRFGRVHDPRLPLPGAVLTREYKGKVLRVTVLDTGFEYGGRVYRSLTAIANEVTGTRWNGLLFFGLTAPRRASGSAAGSAR